MTFKLVIVNMLYMHLKTEYILPLEKVELS